MRWRRSEEERAPFEAMVCLTGDPEWDLHSLQRESALEQELIQRWRATSRARQLIQSDAHDPFREERTKKEHGMQFLIYQSQDGTEGVVALDDISSIVTDSEHEGHSCIGLKSDPETELVARGTPTAVLMGRRVER